MGRVGRIITGAMVIGVCGKVSGRGGAVLRLQRVISRLQRVVVGCINVRRPRIAASACTVA